MSWGIMEAPQTHLWLDVGEASEAIVRILVRDYAQNFFPGQENFSRQIFHLWNSEKNSLNQSKLILIRLKLQ